jgi:hypothetical protein
MIVMASKGHFYCIQRTTKKKKRAIKVRQRGRGTCIAAASPDERKRGAIYLDANTASNTELLGNKSDFVTRGDFNAQLA